MPVQALRTKEELQRFVEFGDRVYEGNPFRVPPDSHHVIGKLSGEAPGAEHSRVQAFWATDGDDRIVATLAAVVDDAFNRYWDERTGHLVFFEALPGRAAEAESLIRAACDWLREQGCAAARMSFLVGWHSPFTVDAYDQVPTFLHTYNPPYYHGYVKNAGFMTEHGFIEYTVEFTPELARAYEQMVGRAAGSGVRLRSWDFERIEEETELFTDLYNEAFAKHWGAPPFTLPEMLPLTVGLKDLLVADFNVFAEADGQAVGFVYALPDLNRAFHPMRGKEIEANFDEFARHLSAIDHGLLLVIGVKENQRGRGINLAMAARSYLAMMERGYKSAAYTYVLDDNWPSRRTAEKLGAKVTRNYVCYRRELA